MTGALAILGADTSPLLTVTIPGGEVNETVANGGQTYGSRTAVAADGVPPYFYAWTRISGSTAITANSASSATTDFSSAGTDEAFSAIFRCTVTDSDGVPQVVSADIGVDVIHGTPP